jgi:adenylate kinase family enzyme
MSGWGRRIWLVGPAGAGKTTLARALRARLALPHDELDRLFWLPGWQQAAVPEFLAAVTELADRDAWLIDGQYDMAHEVLRTRADLVIWVDPPAHAVFPRLLRRTVRRLLSREELWNDNRERLSGALELIRWAAQQWFKVRRRNLDLAAFLARRRVPCLRIRSTAEAARLLAAMPATTPELEVR